MHHASRTLGHLTEYRDPKQVHAGHLLMASSRPAQPPKIEKIALASRVVVSVVLRVEVRVRFVPQGPLEPLSVAARKEGVHID